MKGGLIMTYSYNRDLDIIAKRFLGQYLLTLPDDQLRRLSLPTDRKPDSKCYFNLNRLVALFNDYLDELYANDTDALAKERLAGNETMLESRILEMYGYVPKNSAVCKARFASATYATAAIGHALRDPNLLAKLNRAVCKLYNLPC